MAIKTKSGGPGLGGWLDESLITASPASPRSWRRSSPKSASPRGSGGDAVSFDLERRSHRVLYKTPRLEIALFGWAAGQDTIFHDHGGASGAAFVCSGILIEDTVRGSRRPRDRAAHAHVTGGVGVQLGPDYIHRVSTTLTTGSGSPRSTPIRPRSPTPPTTRSLPTAPFAFSTRTASFSRSRTTRFPP